MTAPSSAAPELPQGDHGSMRELLRVAVPLILSSGSISLMLVVDRIFLTWHSVDALAAAMPAGITFWSLLSLPMGLIMYVNTFVAQYEGAGRPDRVVRSVWQGVFLALVGAVLLLACIPIADPLFRFVGHEPRVRRLETDCFRILCLSGTPMLLAGVLSCFYSGRGRTYVVMWVNIAVSFVNVGLDYLLIFGAGPVPACGIRGAAWATVIAAAVGPLLYVALLYRRRNAAYCFRKNFALEVPLVRRIVKYGLPNGVQFFIDVAAFNVFILIIGRVGRTELAATNVAFNLNTFAFIPMIGLGTAIQILVGQRIGDGRPQLAAETTWNGFRLVTVYMLSFAVIYWVLPRLMIAPFAAFSDVAEFRAIERLAVDLLRFVAAYSLFDGMAIVFGSAVRGAGDTRFSLLLSAACSIAVLLAPTFTVWFWLDGNLYLCWSVCTVFVIVLGIGFYWRFQAGHWMTMRVIEADDIEQALSDTLPELAAEQPT